MSMQFLRGEEPHQMLRFEPDALMSDRPPKEDERLAVERAAFPC
jgi:hypothetical protein